MRVFHNSYTDKEGRSRATAMWYVEFRDHLEILRRLPGCTDHRTTLAIGRNIQRIVWCRVGGESMDPVLTRWITTLSPRLRAKLVEFGILDASKVAALEPLVKHLDGETNADGRVTFIGFRQALAAKGASAAHVDLVASRAKKVVEGCGFVFWSDISASKVMAFLDGLRADRKDKKGNARRGISAQTFNFYLAAFKQFCRWMVRDGRVSESPVTHLSGLNVKTDRRHDRRALSVVELRWLLDTVRNGPKRFGMTGPERAMLYRVAVETGLRRGELASLKRGSFDLDSTHPTVAVEAGYSKHRRRDVLPLRPDTAADLTDLLACKLPDAHAFNVPVDKHESVDVFRADLAAGRAAWLEKAATAEERRKREATSFLMYVDSAGRFADFHSLRHTCGSLLAASGCHPKVAQSIMRHCTIDLTMSRYSHVFAGQEADAVAALPDLGLPVTKAAKATGTDGPVADSDGDGDDDPPHRPPRQPRDGRAPRPSSGQGALAGDNNTHGPTRGEKTGPARLALFLAQDGASRRISANLDELKTRSEGHAENTGKPSGNSAESGTEAAPGEVPERLMGPVSKTGVGLAPPWVRIPPSPISVFCASRGASAGGRQDCSGREAPGPGAEGRGGGQGASNSLEFVLDSRSWCAK